MLVKQFLIHNVVKRLTAKHNGYFNFQTIIDIAGTRGAISLF